LRRGVIGDELFVYYGARTASSVSHDEISRITEQFDYVGGTWAGIDQVGKKEVKIYQSVLLTANVYVIFF